MFGRTLETLMKAEVLEAGRPNRSSFRVQGKGRSWASGETKGNQTVGSWSHSVCSVEETL